MVVQMDYEEENAIDLNLVLGNASCLQIGGIDYTVCSFFSDCNNEDVFSQFVRLLVENFAHSQQQYI